MPDNWGVDVRLGRHTKDLAVKVGYMLQNWFVENLLVLLLQTWLIYFLQGKCINPTRTLWLEEKTMDLWNVL